LAAVLLAMLLAGESSRAMLASARLSFYFWCWLSRDCLEKAIEQMLFYFFVYWRQCRYGVVITVVAKSVIFSLIAV